MLELAVLGLLKEAPMSGYELKKQLSVKLGSFWRVSYGSLYPCLKRLAADGALEVEVAPFTSRKKHVYRLTDHGSGLFHRLLETAEGHDLEQDRFSMRLAFTDAGNDGPSTTTRRSTWPAMLPLLMMLLEKESCASFAASLFTSYSSFPSLDIKLIGAPFLLISWPSVTTSTFFSLARQMASSCASFFNPLK